MSYRLTLALALSLALHGVLLLPDILKRPAPASPPPALQAALRLPPTPEPPALAEPLLKNTLDEPEKAATPEPPPPKAPAVAPPPRTPGKTARREVQVAQRKLSTHLYYPPQAVAQGIEGEVRLILKLGVDGSIDDVAVAASSGHAILDNAAIKAAYAMGRLPGVASRELILPVVFRLE